MWSSLARRAAPLAVNTGNSLNPSKLPSINPAFLSCTLSSHSQLLPGVKGHQNDLDLLRGWGSSPPSTSAIVRNFSQSLPRPKDVEDEYKGMTNGQKFKKMFKDYWYVLIPVHGVTSLAWFGSFYLMCKSGVDVPALLQTLGTSEAYLDKLRGSEWTNILLAYACYKVATPAR